MPNTAILGFAHGHVNAYCTRWRENPDWGVRVVGGWDHDAERLRAAAEQHSLTAFGDLDTLLGRGDVDSVVIASETSRHTELVEQAAAAGKAIVLQKPMALNQAEADRIVAAVERAGVPFTMAWQMRVDPQNLAMKDLLDSGEFGKVFMVRRRHGLSVHLWPDFENMWHADPALNRDMWADDAAHPIDFMLWLLGEPESVTAEIGSLHNPKVPMDNGIAVYRYTHGPIAEVVCSFTCGAAENTTEIVCERGSIIQNFGDGPSCNIPRTPGVAGLRWFINAKGEWTESDIPTPAGHGERIAGLAEPLAAFLRGDRGPIADVREGRTALRMVLACYVSTAAGRRVLLAETGPDAVDIAQV